MKNTKKYKIIILFSYFISSFIASAFHFILELLQYAIYLLSGKYIDVISFGNSSTAVVMITISIIIYCLISLLEVKEKSKQ